MAKKTVVHVVDDIDGTAAQVTVRFSWDGHAYEIDLSAKNARAFQSAVDPYVKAATRVASRRPAKKTLAQLPTVDLAAVREWAVSNGHNVANRGRVPSIVVDAYHAAQRALDDRTTAPHASAAPATNPTPQPRASRKVATKSAAKRKTAAKKAAPRKTGARTAK